MKMAFEIDLATGYPGPNIALFRYYSEVENDLVPYSIPPWNHLPLVPEMNPQCKIHEHLKIAPVQEHCLNLVQMQ